MALKPKNKGHTYFYECCDLTKKVYLDSLLATLGTGSAGLQYDFLVTVPAPGHHRGRRVCRDLFQLW